MEAGGVLEAGQRVDVGEQTRLEVAVRGVDSRSGGEREPLERLSGDGQLMAFEHTGFWQPMDTLREKQLLETLWSSGNAPWKTWP